MRLKRRAQLGLLGPHWDLAVCAQVVAVLEHGSPPFTVVLSVVMWNTFAHVRHLASWLLPSLDAA